jgi:hypothetical protein
MTTTFHDIITTFHSIISAYHTVIIALLFVVIGMIIMTVLNAVLGHSSGAGQSNRGVSMSSARRNIFIYDIVLAVVLVAFAACYLMLPAWHGLVPDDFRLALHATWFGMMGGIVISLKGVYDHAPGLAQGWNDGFDLWHIGRPISGGIVGFMTLVLLYAINPGKEPSAPVVYAAAFILGTQELRFFSFLYEIARLMLQVPQDQESGVLAVIEIQPPHGHQDDVIVVRGKGFTPDVTLSLGGKPVPNLRISSDGTALAGRAPEQAVGPVDVAVQKPNGTRVVLHNGFTYESPAPAA